MIPSRTFLHRHGMAPRGDKMAPHVEEKVPIDLQMRLGKEQIAHRDMHVANGMRRPTDW